MTKEDVKRIIRTGVPIRGAYLSDDDVRQIYDDIDNLHTPFDSMEIIKYLHGSLGDVELMVCFDPDKINGWDVTSTLVHKKGNDYDFVDRKPLTWQDLKDMEDKLTTRGIWEHHGPSREDKRHKQILTLI